MPWAAECTQAQGKGTFKLRGGSVPVQLCPGGLAGPFLSMGDAAKVWEASKAVERFLASHQPCTTPSQPPSSQEVLTATKHPQPEAPFPRRRGWKDHQTSPPDLLPTDVQPRTSRDQAQQLGFLPGRLPAHFWRNQEMEDQPLPLGACSDR